MVKWAEQSSGQAYANLLPELAHVAPDVLLERGARALHDLVALQQRAAVRAQQKRHGRHALTQLVLVQAFRTIKSENELIVKLLQRKECVEDCKFTH